MEERTMILINNLLSEICKKTDIIEEQYEDWLIQEVGFTEDELSDLEYNGYLPRP